MNNNNKAMPASSALINLRVPAATKGRWVRASRAAGMRLTDWVVNVVEAHMLQKISKIIIPDDLTFADLHLAREPDGDVSFDWEVIERICAASHLPIESFRGSSEENVVSLLLGWYQAHRQQGGEADPVAEDLNAEALAEAAAGQPGSYPPGRA